jgi:putative transposase
MDPVRGRIINEVIQDYYLTVQRPSAQKAIQEVARRCLEQNVVAPSDSAIRLRLRDIPESQHLKGRGQKEKASNKFAPVSGSFPNADYPLSVIQIDHTPVDLILVDDIYRRPIGRPWLTLAFDVFSRMVTGYYLSFDPPSETSVAMCVAHSILKKEDWLVLHQVDAKWPVWGIPRTIHVDNGADFRSDNFKNSCAMYNIHLEYRPVKQPRYGGHIERMLGTLAREIHALPGTTFSSIKERDSYDSEKYASMTKSEFEKWLVTLICNAYHQRVHSSIGVTPLRKWDIGVFGNAEVRGTGLPPTMTDRMRVLLDFLPSFHRTVQPFGVTIEGLTYYDECLRHRINEFDKSTGSKRTFVFRRDPRDISIVWYFDPDFNEYFRVPVADQSIPTMSIWEFNKVKDTLRKEGASSEDKVGLLRVLNDLRTQVEEASAKTKKARRQAQRRREHEKAVSPARPLQAPTKPSIPSTAVSRMPQLADGDLTGFGEIR